MEPKEPRSGTTHYLRLRQAEIAPGTDVEKLFFERFTDVGKYASEVMAFDEGQRRHEKGGNDRRFDLLLDARRELLLPTLYTLTSQLDRTPRVPLKEKETGKSW